MSVQRRLLYGALLLIFIGFSEESSNWYAVDDKALLEEDIQLLPEPHRVRRDSALSGNETIAPTVTTGNAVNKTAEIKTDQHPVTVSTTAAPSSNISVIGATITQKIPNVGQNGSGIRKDGLASAQKPGDSNAYNSTVQGDNHASKKLATDSAEAVNPDQHLHNLTETNFEYYNSTFIANADYFKEIWANITNMSLTAHPILSSSHRRAATVSLSFDFPFYGHSLKNVTVATGGFVYTGEQVHHWLAATQYIAPLMANFDTRVSNDSLVKIADDGNNLTVVWENVLLLQNSTENTTFTFALTLRKSGDIVFVYKDIPTPVQDIEDRDHPVKVGISDAYVSDRILFLKRRKTIYEYHRINFLRHNITSGTVLVLRPNPTCLVLDTCSACVSHPAININVNCSWCPAMEVCSSSIDRKKQDWLLRNCTDLVTELDKCAAPTNTTIAKADYTTDFQNKTVAKGSKEALTSEKAPQGHSSVSGVVLLLVVICLLGVGSGWVFYAYKNPHTRSGQLLIKYRPSTWSWKRGEARYTAATIHM